MHILLEFLLSSSLIYKSVMINRLSATLLVLTVLLLVHLIRLRQNVKISQQTPVKSLKSSNQIHKNLLEHKNRLKNRVSLKTSNSIPIVPFYLYPDSELDWYSACLKNPNNSFTSHKNFKHGDDIHFIEKLKNHP